MINSFPKRQAGLSLVELMIAITLSLLLIAGVLQIFLSSKQTYSTNNALSRVQESGRFAMDFLSQDIRNTGYKGQCLDEPVIHGNIGSKASSGSSEALMSLETPIYGWDNIESATALPQSPSITPVTGTDAILIKLAAGPKEIDAANTNTTSNDTISLGSNTSGVAQHAITLISDAISCELFKNTATTNTTSIAKAPGSPWEHAYTGAIEVLPLQNATYYIRANANGRPNSLVRQRLSSDSTQPIWITEELVDGVKDMQISYGIATGADKQVTRYDTADEVTADNNWDNVVAVRIDLLVESADTNVVPENQVIAFNSTNVTIENRRLAQVFSTTIGIRNRLP